MAMPSVLAERVSAPAASSHSINISSVSWPVSVTASMRSGAYSTEYLLANLPKVPFSEIFSVASVALSPARLASSRRR